MPPVLRTLHSTEEAKPFSKKEEEEEEEKRRRRRRRKGRTEGGGERIPVIVLNLRIYHKDMEMQ
jgi:hypothetical protein